MVPINRHIGSTALPRLGDGPNCTLLDLIEWKTPATERAPYPNLYHSGIARIALLTKNIHRVYEDLKAEGIKFFSEPKTIRPIAGVQSDFSATRSRSSASPIPTEL
jgi:hypothetical protein